MNGKKLFPEPGPDKALKLAVEAHFDYIERRLAGTGREALSFPFRPPLRSGRGPRLKPANRSRTSKTAKSERLIVAAGQAEGIDLFSPSGPLTYGELELLRIPCDSLAMLALLPDSAVAEAGTWKAPDWALPLLTGVESIEKGSVTCKLESLRPGEGRIHFRRRRGGRRRGLPQACSSRAGSYSTGAAEMHQPPSK